MNDINSIASTDPIPQLQELTRKIDKEQPDPADLQALRDLLTLYPDLSRTVADLPQLALNRLATQLQNRPVFNEALKQRLSNLKSDLGYDSASPVERLMIEQILLSWLRLYYIELAVTQLAQTSLTAYAHWDKRLTTAQHRYLKACQALARIRKLTLTTPALQVNIAAEGGQQINKIG
jgi:hypothetical protein